MPCGLCNTWIDGEWIDWRECYAQPTEDNRILVHTSSLPAFDTPCVVHLVSVTSYPSWYFFCRACRMNLRTIRAGFLGQGEGNPAGSMESEIRLRRVMVPPDYPWNAPYWPTLHYKGSGTFKKKATIFCGQGRAQVAREETIKYIAVVIAGQHRNIMVPRTICSGSCGTNCHASTTSVICTHNVSTDGESLRTIPLS